MSNLCEEVTITEEERAMLLGNEGDRGAALDRELTAWAATWWPSVAKQAEATQARATQAEAAQTGGDRS